MKRDVIELKKNYNGWWHIWKCYINEGKFDMANGMVSGLFMADIISCKLSHRLIEYLLYRELYQGQMSIVQFMHRHH